MYIEEFILIRFIILFIIFGVGLLLGYVIGNTQK